MTNWRSLYKNVSVLDIIGAKNCGGSNDNWSCKTCKSPVELSPPTNQHPAFYRPDDLPVAQPTVSEHWRKKCHIPRTFSSQASRQPQTSSVKRTVAQHCFTGWMPFLSPNQQCQSIEGRYPMQPKYQNYVTLGIYYCSLNLLLLRSSFV